MKKSLWQQILNTGIRPDQIGDYRLEMRIRLSNIIGLTIILLTVVFSVLSFSKTNFDVKPFLVLILIASSIVTLNKVGFTKLSRMVTCLTPAVGLLYLNISQKVNDPASVEILNYATPRMLILGSAVIPFAMFADREKGFLITTVILIFVLVFGYDLIHQTLLVDYHSLGLTTSKYGIIYEDLVILAIMILLSSGFMFNMDLQYAKRTQAMIDDAHRQTEQLKHNEESMQKTLAELEESRKKDEERSWISSGLNDVASLLQSGDELESVYDRVLSKVITHCQFNQGGLFLSDKDESGNTILRLVSSFAYNRKKFIEKTIQPGEGIAGQVFLEKDLAYFKDVPDGYVKITSGLGEATPKHLVVFPLQVNHSVEGVMELASFEPLELKHFDYFAQLGENLASFIANNKVNARTKQLLEQAQTMSAEMKESEEEMRQNLEELQATQEALARKETEYQKQIVSLEKELEDLKKSSVS